MHKKNLCVRIILNYERFKNGRITTECSENMKSLENEKMRDPMVIEYFVNMHG